MITTSELIRLGAPSPGPGRWYAVTVAQAGCDEDYGWGDSAEVLLCESRSHTVTKGVFRRRTERVTSPVVIRRVYRALKGLRSVDDALPVIVSMCKEVVDRQAAEEAHTKAVADLASRVVRR